MGKIQKKRFVLTVFLFCLISYNVIGLNGNESNFTKYVNISSDSNYSYSNFLNPLNVNLSNPNFNNSDLNASEILNVSLKINSFSKSNLSNSSLSGLPKPLKVVKKITRFNVSILKIPEKSEDKIIVNGTQFSFSKLGNNLMVFGKKNNSSFRFSIPMGYSLNKIPKQFKKVFDDNKELILGQMNKFGFGNPQKKLSRGLLKSSPKNSDKVPVIIKFRGGTFNLKDNLKKISKYRGALANSFNLNSKIKELGSVNSISISLSKEDLKKIASLDYVEHVYPDATVHALLKDSVPEINGNKVWNITKDGRKINGFNVTIAIIDTGIDYNLSALGGCFGNGCKVKGGYDFVNLDNDPVDDAGHGTHCAGIAAGNGDLKGVAPNATLYAYKVLNSYGEGRLSDIILAIERSVDPNQDGDYSDHIDVDSLSLGTRSGDPDDLLSQSVDFAVESGVTVVIAAGNSGPASQTVGSPGTSRDAITVGASCMQSQIGDQYCSNSLASFSSRGPTSVGIKPDVVAPGVSICSLESEDNTIYNPEECFGSGYISMSGTSMATPHVAGAVALLIQAKKWNPEEIKSALMLNSKDLGLSPNSQGTGEIDVLSAYNASFLIDLTSLDYGNTNPEIAYSKKLVITNVKDKPLNLTLNISELYLESGFTAEKEYVSVNETKLKIPAFESKTIKLTVNYTGNKQDFYSGYLKLKENNKTHLFPFSFITSTRLLVRLKGGELYPDFVVLNDNLDSKTTAEQNYDFSGNQKYFSLSPGNYTVYAIGDFQNPNLEYIISKKVYVKYGELTELNLSILDSREFTLRGTDLNNTPLQFLKLNRVLNFYNSYYSYSYEWSTYFQDWWDIFYGLKKSVGNRKIYISNKPKDNINTDVILSYYGVPE